MEKAAMDKTPLESSIREESRRMILAIREKETSEIVQLETDYVAEIESFRKKNEDEIEAKIAKETGRLENMSIIELKKLKLRVIEDFVDHLVEETAKGMRNDPRYKKFLLHTVCDAANRIQGRVEVRLKKEDSVFEKEIIEAVKADDKNRDIAIHEDNTIKWGGCIVQDEPGGRIFNGTIERIYFRKSLVIRQEVVQILKQKGFPV